MSTPTSIRPQHFGLGHLPSGVYFSSVKQAEKENSVRGQLHHIRRAFDAVCVDGVLCVDGRPTVYFKDYKAPLTRKEINHCQKLCWNQGVATVLVLRDPHQVYIFSGLIKPSDDELNGIFDHEAFVESLQYAAGVLESHKLVENIASGHYYRKHQDHFFEKTRTVDQFLIKMLSELSSHLNVGGGKETLRHIHAFLGRLIFTCYLVDRSIICLKDYPFIRRQGVESLPDLFETYNADEALDILFDNLFPRLNKEFNGSTFEADVDVERRLIGEDQISLLRRFFKGEAFDSPQQSLGFWAFDFSVIPVETISALYENFLEREDVEDKNSKGAFYTPRHLAEMVVAEALEGDSELLNKRFLDPSCGSGIFLVIIYNRLAEEWSLLNRDKTDFERIEALIGLFGNLRGIDVNETACRITCFSLYIAFLDQFDPPLLRDLKDMAGRGKRKPLLPPLLAYKKCQYDNVLEATVFEGNYFDSTLPLNGGFDFIVGNPPWVSRQAVGDEVSNWMAGEGCPVKDKSAALSQDQIALAFLWKIPSDLAPNGTSCLILPSQVLLNKTDDFQKEWFSRYNVTRLLHLADYRRFLFENAIRPCFVLHFGQAQPKQSESIEYVVPKVTRADPRSGLIPVSAEDRRFIRLPDLLQAAKDDRAALLWKTNLWGTYRDLELIDTLMTYPTLGDNSSHPDAKVSKRFSCGKGFQPWYDIAAKRKPKSYGQPKPLPGTLSHLSIGELEDRQTLIGLARDATTLNVLLKGQCYSGPVEEGIPEEQLRASTMQLRRGVAKKLCKKPLVVVSKGFGKVAFFDKDIICKDPLTAISGGSKDEKLLKFLAVYLRSKLAWYLVFHTAGALGAERNEVRLHELLRLPFPLPDSEAAVSNAKEIIEAVADEIGKTQKHIESIYKQEKSRVPVLHPLSIPEQRHAAISELQKRLEVRVYEYFGLNEEDRALVEDTCNIYWPSATPNSPTADIATLRGATPIQLKEFSERLSGTLNKWADLRGKKTQTRRYLSAEYASMPKVGLCMVVLRRSAKKTSPIQAKDNGCLEEVLARIAEASIQERGAFTYLRSIVHSTPEAIYIVKPDLRGQWTQTAALNLASGVFGAVLSAAKDCSDK